MATTLAGRVALVTGAGRGIGRAHALHLASQGASVVVCDLGVGLDGVGEDPTVALGVAEEIIQAGGAAVALTIDVATFAGGERAIAQAMESFGRIDIVINNAGISGGGTSIETLAEAALHRVFAVNFEGALGVARAAWPHMRRQAWGRIINTVSEVALDTRFFGAGIAYAAAKAAVWSMTLSLAEEGRLHGITVNAISPGAATRMNEALFSTNGPPAIDLDPLHVARVASWLASEAAAGVTGKIIHAAGGLHREYLTRRHRNTELTRWIERDLTSDIEPLNT